MSQPPPMNSQIDKYFDLGPITIGEVLETAAVSVRDEPVESSDASAIQEAERRCNTTGDEMQGDVLADALSKLPQDKAVTSEDAEAVKVAELRGRSQATARPGGVADTITKAAKVNMHD
ncbi:hypothetical protein F3Y22_tig00111621pilonHSYRG00283 [Hibiscus syriacus]|uniref:SMP domain-containing protein n=1 Tax=Hibiscus syriacus TaxID=106335 RepID=A0A6A2YJ97_HIBSY|nr:hypothetical protein F3Y22_tig00111621pilonHSYRG00283 [Hibiscus syriacus]